MMGLYREGRSKIHRPCFLVVWHTDSERPGAMDRMQYFLFGRTYEKNGRRYEYPGFLSRDGVRYIAQSAVLVVPELLDPIVSLLSSDGADYEVERLVPA